MFVAAITLIYWKYNLFGAGPVTPDHAPTVLGTAGISTATGVHTAHSPLYNKDQ